MCLRSQEVGSESRLQAFTPVMFNFGFGPEFASKLVWRHKSSSQGHYYLKNLKSRWMKFWKSSTWVYIVVQESGGGFYLWYLPLYLRWLYLSSTSCHKSINSFLPCSPVCSHLFSFSFYHPSLLLLSPSSPLSSHLSSVSVSMEVRIDPCGCLLYTAVIIMVLNFHLTNATDAFHP